MHTKTRQQKKQNRAHASKPRTIITQHKNEQSQESHNCKVPQQLPNQNRHQNRHQNRKLFKLDNSQSTNRESYKNDINCKKNHSQTHRNHINNARHPTCGDHRQSKQRQCAKTQTQPKHNASKLTNMTHCPVATNRPNCPRNRHQRYIHASMSKLSSRLLCINVQKNTLANRQNNM